jgi:predicted RNase H-like nuclease (RuvC/YqgF family)
MDRVKFLSEEASGKNLSPKVREKRKLIVGVDPGTTCGLAVLNFNSKPLYIDSRKDLALGDVARIVMGFGEPVIVAADVTTVPDFVAGLAKSLDAVIFTPRSLLDSGEKQCIAQKYAGEYGFKLKTPHERDALVAAIKAFKHYKNKFKRVEVEARRKGLSLSLDEVKELVVRGHSIRRAIALRSITGKTEEGETGKIVPYEKRVALSDVDLKLRRLRKRLSNCKNRVKQLKDSNEGFKGRVRNLELKIIELQNLLDYAKKEESRGISRERKYRILRMEISTLRKQLNDAREEAEQYKMRLKILQVYKKLEASGEVIQVKPIERFTKDGLDEAFRLYDIKKGDAVTLLDSSGGGVSTSMELARRGVKVVIAGTTMAHQAEETLRKYGVTVLSSKDLKIEWVEGHSYVKKGEVEKAVKEAAKKEGAEAGKGIEGIVGDYREEKMRSTRKV